MAKKKANVRSKAQEKPRKRPQRKSSQNGFFRWRLLLIVLVLVLIFLYRGTITAWAVEVAEDVSQLFGWGLLFPVIAFGVLVGLFWRRRLLSIFRYWNLWLGGIAFVLVVWGVLAYFALGGSIGVSIVAYPFVDWVGILRLIGLTVIGVILVAPRAYFRLVAKMGSWLGKQFERKPVPRPTRLEPPPAPYRVAEPRFETRPSVLEKPAMPIETVAVNPPVIKQEKVTPTPGTVSSTAQRDLKQVAQEVWRKYGESQSLVTIDGWQLPPIDILDTTPEIEFSEADNLQRAKLIEDALVSYGVEAKVVQINTGPTVTQFGVEPGWDRKMKEIREKDSDGNVRVRLEEVSKTRVKVDRITSLANDLALALSAPTIRMEAPVPGKPVVGIEVPNTIHSLVSLRGVIETSAFQKTENRSKLTLALGKGAGGEAIAADLSRMPHLLIAGATGSGKTVCLNAVICCLLLHNAPVDVRLIMIDPKRVELTPFNSIPHLATPVIVDTHKALNALHWLNREMDRRYQELAREGARNIESYNRNKQGEEKLPYLVLIIDELADLMMTGLDEVEHILCRLAQLARATGIHLVVATQRPSVDVITGLIKANFPTRISFAVTSQVDSRTILDIGGAEKLLGRGDMLYMPTEAGKPKRLQGCYVSDAETERLVYFWGSQRKQEIAQLKVEEFTAPTAAAREKREDPLLDAARQLAEEHRHISTSFLQRRLRIGYPRAARIMEQLQEEMGGEEKGEGDV